uniref:dolichyl-diphosphooligosaccharide--protein glycotransferase n=1 Tax=Salix viminalis TaxID=40686 RepID=A0A6N2KPG6_SALVM
MAVTKTEPINGSTTKSSAPPLPLKTKQQELLIRVSILCLVYVLAFITRLFSVLRYESMIHEFDPYFNYRTTLFLTQKGFYEFWNWFDSESWYPLGRIIGGTLYPGLMVTAAMMYWGLRFLRFAVHIREVCVLTAPFFASNTTFFAYFFGKEIWDTGAGLVAAVLIAICPGAARTLSSQSNDLVHRQPFPNLPPRFSYLSTVSPFPAHLPSQNGKETSKLSNPITSNSASLPHFKHSLHVHFGHFPRASHWLQSRARLSDLVFSIPLK